MATKADEAALRSYVTDFMSSSGARSTHELEARVRGGVSAAVFSSVLRRLQGSGAGMWAFTSVEESVDMAFSDRSRTTVVQPRAVSVGGGGGGGSGGAPAPPPPTHVRKRRLAEPYDFELADAASGRCVPFRVSCAEEEPLVAAPASAAPETYRVKKRYSFNRKHEMQFDLTEVRTGGSLEAARRAPPMFEVELEWRGQENAAKGAYASVGGAPRMADVFLCKLRDLCALVGAATGEEERGASTDKGRGGGGSGGGSVAAAEVAPAVAGGLRAPPPAPAPPPSPAPPLPRAAAGAKRARPEPKAPHAAGAAEEGAEAPPGGS
jgi:hypothetical protein